MDRQLLALVADQLAVGNWQRTGDKKNRPKPIPRPGVNKKSAVGDASQVTPTQARELLDSFMSPN